MPRKFWTDADDEDLRVLAAKRTKQNHLDWVAIKARFPDRTQAAISLHLTKRGLTDSKVWTQAEDDLLHYYWNECSGTALQAKLPGRTKDSIYRRARDLGMRGGVPQGMVSVASLALSDKWGYAYDKTLRMFNAAKVRVRRFNYAGQKHRIGVLYVKKEDALRAAKVWEKAQAKKKMGKETPFEAAKRLGCWPAAMWNWLTKAELVAAKEPNKKREFYALPAVFDRVHAKYQRKKPQKSPSKAALSKWKGRTPRRTPPRQRTRSGLPGASAGKTASPR